MSTLKLLLLFLSLGGLAAVNWTSSYSKRSVVCAGSNITLGWNFTIKSGETLKVIEWLFTPRTTGAPKYIAVFENETLTPTSDYAARLQHDGWIVVLSGLTAADAGTYEVLVTSRQKTNSNTTVSRRLVVIVAGPAITNAIEMEQIIRPDADGDVHLRLTCGNLTWPGKPPVDVVWKTPSGSELNSTGYKSHSFYLTLGNPATGGTYTCTMPTSAFPALCMKGDDPLTAKENVDADNVRLLLIERQEAETRMNLTERLLRVERVNKLLAQQLEHVMRDNRNTTQHIQRDKGGKKQLAERIQQLKREHLVLAHRMQSIDDHRLTQERQRIDRINLLLNRRFTDMMKKNIEQTRQFKLLQLKNQDILLQIKETQAHVGFHARLSEDMTILGDDEVVKFQTVMFNDGNAYNQMTGTFTAPRNGYYFFTYTVSPYTVYYWCKCTLKVNGMIHSWTAAKGNPLNPSTGHAVVFLKSGDTVALHSWGYRNQYEYYSMFSGFLIRS